MQTTIPPGQTFAKRWAIYAAFGVPRVDLAAWRLSTSGLVERELSLSFDDLQKLPQLKLKRDFHCLGPGGIVLANPEPKAIEDIEVGDRIIGLDGKHHVVRRLVRKRHKGTLLRLKASYLPEVSVTPDHKIWAIRGHEGVGKSKSQRRKKTFISNPKPNWIVAADLHVGDYVFFPSYCEIENRKTITWMGRSFSIDADLAYVLGWYVAEGSGGDSDGRVVAFALNKEQNRQVERLAAALKRLFGARISVYKERNMNLVKVTSGETPQIGRALKTWCGVSAETKQIPQFLLNSKPQILRIFLEAMIDGDGYRPWRLESKRSASSREDFLDIATLSAKLAYQLILAFSKIGVAGDLVDHPGSVRSGYSVRVRGFNQIAKVFPNETLPQGPNINRRRFWPTKNGFYYPVTEIQPVSYNGPVYDLVADNFTMLSPFATLDCVTAWSIKDVVWEGVAFREIAKLTGVKPEAMWVMFHCADGYTAPVPLEDAMVEDSLVATKMNGKPIPVQQGYPVRPFIPHLYGWKSAKWLTAIEFLAEYEDGYWEAYSYHERGNIWSEERFKGQGGKHARHKGLGSLPV
jgi:DMSO/TMAO reductase YedYZ molybdopterin-dependent catalytic subunit